MPKVFVLGSDSNIERMFSSKGWVVTKDIEESDVIQFTGGADVSPSMYGESLHPKAVCNLSRDAQEKAIFDKFHKKKVLAGICRGGQFLNVMCGGRMYQHHSGHPYKHNAKVYTDMLDVIVSSTHHQLMIPNLSRGFVAMWAEEGVVSERMEGGDICFEAPDFETEAVVYPDDGVLCFQPHPEYCLHDKELNSCRDVYFNLLDSILNTGG